MATFSSEEEKKAEERDVVLVTWQLNDPVKKFAPASDLPEEERVREEGWREKTGETGVCW